MPGSRVVAHRTASHGSALLLVLLALLPVVSSRAEDASTELTAADTAHDDQPLLPPEQAASVSKRALPERLLDVEAASPLNGFDANTAFWLSESELLGRAGDWLGLRAGLDKSAVGRGALTAGTLWLTIGSSYYSHEIAHRFVDRKHGPGTGPALDFANWWEGLWPAYEDDYAVSYGWEERCLSLVSGLNQNQWLARDAWRVAALRGQRDEQEAITYLVWKLANLNYIVWMGLKDGRPLGRRLHPEAVDTYAENYALWNDIDMYTLYLYSRGQSLSKRGYLVQTMAADLLSFHTWESFWGGLRYLARGERESRMATVSLGRGVRITPPMITAYATSEGTFYDLTSVLNPGRPRQWLLSIGADAAIARGSALRRVRIGGQYQGFRWASLTADPFVYLDANRGTHRQGIAVGTDVRWRLSRSVSLAASVKYTDRDVIENAVKAVQVPDAGFKAIFGVRAVY